MKSLTLSLFLFTFFITKAQWEDRCVETVQRQLVDKIKGFNSTDLLPYYDEHSKKWGFFHKNSGEKLTEGIMDHAHFFSPHLDVFITYQSIREDNTKVDRYCKGKIKGSRFNYESSVYEVSSFCSGIWPKDKPEAKVKQNIKGFEVDKNGKLTYVAPQYYRTDYNNGTTYFNDIFKFKGKYYAIAYSKKYDHYHIIDQKGKIIRKINRKNAYTIYLKPIYSKSKDVWIRINDSFEGIFSGKKIKHTMNYVAAANKELGYEIVDTADGMGLLDLTTMEWKITPSKNLIISSLKYTSSEELAQVEDMMDIPTELVEENRKKADIYFLENHKITDFNGKIYQPK